MERKLREETSIGEEQLGLMPCKRTTGVNSIIEKTAGKEKRITYGIY